MDQREALELSSSVADTIVANLLLGIYEEIKLYANKGFTCCDTRELLGYPMDLQGKVTELLRLEGFKVHCNMVDYCFYHIDWSKDWSKISYWKQLCYDGK